MTGSVNGKRKRVFARLWKAGLHLYDELQGIGWDWQSLDSSTSKAPFAQAAVGPAPTDRGKQGTRAEHSL